VRTRVKELTMRVAEAIAAQSLGAGEAAIWWLGQNSFLLRGAGVDIMIDPYFSRPSPPERYLHSEAPIAAEEFGPDAVFCTHDHSDHTDPGYLLPLSQSWPETTFFGPPESAARMVGAGIPEVRVSAIESGDIVEVDAASVEVVLSKTEAVSDVAHYGYVVDFGGARIYDTGDIMRGATREAFLMEPIRQARPHIALITTSPTEEEFPDFEEAAALARSVGVRVAIPAHYSCFANRTFDPAPFAALFNREEGPRGAIIPYCGCFTFTVDEAGRVVDV
jgi:L-ascorbate 6-phosphate lactonase